MLENLPFLRDGRSRRASSFDRTGGNIDSIAIGAHETLTVADLQGAGVIRRMWFTVLAGGDYLRRLVLRIYWDNMDRPSVEAPLGDFFGIGHARMGQLNTAVMSVSSIMHEGTPLGGLVCHWPMPYSERALVTVENDSEHGVMGLFHYVDYDDLPSLPEGQLRFHALWRRSNPCPPPRHCAKDPQVNLSDRDNYLIADIWGRGHYVGCNLSVHNLYGGWWGEGDDMFMVDGEKWPPDLHGTGSEDYFGHAWGMQKDNGFLCNGVSFYKEGTRPGNINERITVYRYHLNDPVVFRRSLRVSIEHGHANDRCDDYASTAYWYQTLPHKRFPGFPCLEDRLPRPDAAVHIQALDLPAPIRDGRQRSGQGFETMDVRLQKARKQRRRD